MLHYRMILLCIASWHFGYGQKLPEIELLKDIDIVMKPSFKSCHASTITEIPGGKLMAAWFAGPFEGHREVNIVMAVFDNDKWSEPVGIADGVINDSLRYPCWNPVLYTNESGLIYLYYKVGPSPREWWGMVKVSMDSGVSWSPASRLPDGFLGPIKNKPVESGDGFLLHPSSTESLDEKKWNIHIDRSDLNSGNWQKIRIDNDTFGAIQPSIIRYTDRRLQILCRSRQNAILQSWSEDNGETWTKLSKTNIINPNSGIDAVTLSEGLQLLVYNPAKSGNDWSEGRNELQVAVSYDGSIWKNIHQLVNKAKGEFSYPAIIETSDRKIHITYTNNRKNIRHVILRIK